MAEPKIKQLQQTLEENLFWMKRAEDKLKDREKMKQKPIKRMMYKCCIANGEDENADILGRISAENKKNMNLAFTIGNKRQGNSFGVGVPGAPGADHLREYIGEFLGGKRRKTRRKTRRRKTKKRRKTRRRRKPKKITIVGYPSCDYYIKARRAAKAFFGVSNVTDIKFSSKLKYKNWLKKKDGIKFSSKAKSHKTCPFVWTNNKKYIGGCDDTLVLINKLKKKNYK
jgi:glutaredoxin